MTSLETICTDAKVREVFKRASLSQTNNICIAELIKNHGIKSMLEVGTALGGGLILPAYLGCHVTSVDNLARDRRECLKNIEDAGVAGNVKLIDAETSAYLPTLKENSYELVHVDGDQTYAAVKRDLSHAVRISSKLVTAHDTDNEKWQGARQAFEEITKQFSDQIKSHYLIPHHTAAFGLGIILLK